MTIDQMPGTHDISRSKVEEIVSWKKPDASNKAGSGRQFDFSSSTDPLIAMNGLDVQRFIKQGAEVSGGGWDFSSENAGRREEKIVVPSAESVRTELFTSEGLEVPPTNEVSQDVWGDLERSAHALLPREKAEAVVARIQSIDELPDNQFDATTKAQLKQRMVNEAVLKQAHENIAMAHAEQDSRQRSVMGTRALKSVVRLGRTK